MQSFEQAYYEADTHWSEGMLEDTRNIRRIIETASLIPMDTKSILDAGCGNGVFGHHVESVRPEIKVVGIDRSESALRYVRTEKRQGDVTALPLSDQSFDTVSCLEVIEHLPVGAYETALSELTRVARKYVIIGVPYREKTHKNVTACPQCQTVFNVDLHLRSFDDRAIYDLLKDYKFMHLKSIYPDSQSVPVGSLELNALISKIKNVRSGERFRSPICPLCGYTERTRDTQYSVVADEPSLLPNWPLKQKMVQALSTALKKMPKRQMDGYWVAALYERIG